MGSSHLYQGIDTPYLQAELSRELGRPAVARTIGWGGAGYDALYFIAKDLLSQRRVRTLVVYDEVNRPDQRNIQSPIWFRWSDDAREVAGLPWQERARFYLASIVGMPRCLLGMLHRNYDAELVPQIPNEQEMVLHAPSPATRLGSFPADAGFRADPLKYDFPPFTRFAVSHAERAKDVKAYTEENAATFEFGDQPIPTWQSFFVKKLSKLAHDHGTKLIFIHIPTFDERRAQKIRERVCWPRYLEGDVALIGIPADKLFLGLTDDQIRLLYFNPGHFNRNGMEYFTQVITPAISNLLTQQIHD
jgi:hypothetical protein